jgi:hypothetical protein
MCSIHNCRDEYIRYIVFHMFQKYALHQFNFLVILDFKLSQLNHFLLSTRLRVESTFDFLKLDTLDFILWYNQRKNKALIHITTNISMHRTCIRSS